MWLTIGLIMTLGLIVMGLGIGGFFDAMFQGTEKVVKHPIVRENVDELKEKSINYIKDGARGVVMEVLQ